MCVPCMSVIQMGCTNGPPWCGNQRGNTPEVVLEFQKLLIKASVRRLDAAGQFRERERVRERDRVIIR